jgi:hypothetical protein
LALVFLGSASVISLQGKLHAFLYVDVLETTSINKTF